MRDVNVCVFSGRLGADPQMRYTAEGTAVTSLRMATNTGRDSVMWLDVTVWREQGENVNKYLHKGDALTVQGYMKEDTWETDTGERRSKKVMTANFVLFGPKRTGETAEAREDEPHTEPQEESAKGPQEPEEAYPF